MLKYRQHYNSRKLVTKNRGVVSNEELQAVKDAGYTDGDVLRNSN